MWEGLIFCGFSIIIFESGQKISSKESPRSIGCPVKVSLGGILTLIRREIVWPKLKVMDYLMDLNNVYFVKYMIKIWVWRYFSIKY